MCNKHNNTVQQTHVEEPDIFFLEKFLMLHNPRVPVGFVLDPEHFDAIQNRIDGSAYLNNNLAPNLEL